MLIKHYTLDGSLYIIDNVQDVHVPTNPAMGDYSLEAWKVFDFDDPKETVTVHKPKIITYVCDGPCVLKVYGISYICNNDGKTIEKVIGNGCA